MKIVFMGTPGFAVNSLNALACAGHEIVGVVTQPDKPVGRKRIITKSPVKMYAEAKGIAVYQPRRIRDAEAVAYISEWEPDLIVTAAYGQILPLELLEMPRLGAINVHASLLPKYRGAAPINRAIIDGEKVTGITIMHMTEQMDAGDIILQKEIEIGSTITAGELTDLLSEIGAELLVDAVALIAGGEVRTVKQDELLVTYAPMIKREDELIDFARSSEAIANQIRGLNPTPNAYTYRDGTVFKVISAEANNGSVEAEPGTIVEINKDQLVVATGDGSISLFEVQPAGKKAMTIAQFLQGTRLQKGDRFGESK